MMRRRQQNHPTVTAKDSPGPCEFEARGEASGGCVLWSAAWLASSLFFAAWLRGFVDIPPLIVLSVIGGSVALVGFYVLYDAASAWSRGDRSPGGVVMGIGFLLASTLSLLPQAPDRFLTSTSIGMGLLEGRTERLEAALRGEQPSLVRRLARRGLGNPAPTDATGNPLLFDAQEASVLRILLDHRFDPDAQDLEGRTLLMHAAQRGDPERVQILLDAGADTNLRDNLGQSLGDYASGNPDIARLLGAGSIAGQDRGASNRELREQARSDWLALATEPSAMASKLTVAPDQLLFGDVAKLRIQLHNPTDREQLLITRAVLNQSALFVSGSHGASIENPSRAQLSRTIRWPLLALPAGRSGVLELHFVVPGDGDSGDLSIDVRTRELGTFAQEGEQLLNLYRTPSWGDLEISGLWWLFPSLLFGGLLAGFLVLTLFLRRKRPSQSARADRRVSGTRILTAVKYLGLAITVSLLWSMIAPFVTLEPTQCTVLDQRVRLRSYEAMTTSASSPGNRSLSTSSTYRVPQVAVQIDTDRDPVIATGFSTGWASASVHDLRFFPIGATVPCFIDRDDPTQFTFRRRPGFGALTALFVLGLCVLLVFSGLRWVSPRE